MSTRPGCVVRFFEHNDRNKKHLLRRIVCEGKGLKEALAVAYHSLDQTSDATIDTLISVEVEIMVVPSVVEAP